MSPTSTSWWGSLEVNNSLSCPILGLSWAYLGPILGLSGAYLGLSWAYLGPILAYLGPILAYLGTSWPFLGLSWPILGHHVLIFCHPGPILAVFGPILGPAACLLLACCLPAAYLLLACCLPAACLLLALASTIARLQRGGGGGPPLGEFNLLSRAWQVLGKGKFLAELELKSMHAGLPLRGAVDRLTPLPPTYRAQL